MAQIVEIVKVIAPEARDLFWVPVRLWTGIARLVEKSERALFGSQVLGRNRFDNAKLSGAARRY